MPPWPGRCYSAVCWNAWVASELPRWGSMCLPVARRMEPAYALGHVVQEAAYGRHFAR
jgi:hypothetical protein